MMLTRRAAALFLVAASSALAAASIPQRIVSLAPSVTELLYAIGAFPRVVAVSQYCNFPPQVSRLPKVGGWMTSNIESIVASRPDLVILTNVQKPFIADRLTAFGLHWVAVPSESLPDVFEAMRELGAASGNEKEALELARRTRASLAHIRLATSKLAPRSVLVVVDRTPGTLTDLYVATKGSYLVDLIDLVGGRSVADPTPSGYGKISKEAVLAVNPEVIIDLVHASNANLSEQVNDVWNDLPELKAVRSKQVYRLNDPFVVHPSQFVVHTAELFEQVVHPEAVRRGEH